MKILITNDDGIEAAGLKALADRLAEVGDVTVVAPAGEYSGASQSITVHSPLRYKEVRRGGRLFGYAVSGTPVDCVKLALADILDTEPDIVISGINRGPNNATNILYSGTVGGAYEGAVNGITSVAVSLVGFIDEQYGTAADFTAKFIRNVLFDKRNESIVYNINVPNLPMNEVKGVRFTKMSMQSYLINYDKRYDPFNIPYFWLSDFRAPEKENSGCDDEALACGYISVTPLKIDRTDHDALHRLRGMEDISWF